MKWLAVLLLLIVNLSGCTLSTQQGGRGSYLSVVDLEKQTHWLKTAHDYMDLSPKQALAKIKTLPSNRSNPFERYRYALLNQQLRDRTGWVRARDTLRLLSKDENLEREFRWLTEVLLDYNQAMINAEERQHQMAVELTTSQAAQQELSDKIQALTNLEQKISVRKGKVAEMKVFLDDE